MRLRSHLATLLLTVFLLSACDKTTVTHHFQPLPAEGWSRADTLTFDIPPVPADDHYTLALGIRYAPRFPYQDIWLVAETRLRHPSRVRRDTLHLFLTDTTGAPTGTGVGLLQHEAPLPHLQLREGQEGNIRVRHIMARETLPFITDVGIRLQRGVSED